LSPFCQCFYSDNLTYNKDALMFSVPDRPKRTLVAYCTLAERLKSPGANISGALTPFFAEAAKQFSGQLFDASKLAAALKELFGMDIPRLAVVGLAEQLASDGILVAISGHPGSFYKYAEFSEDPSATSPITEGQIQMVLDKFVAYCREDDFLFDREPSALCDGFIARLLNIDSMRIISRRDGSINAKKTPRTLGLKKDTPDLSELDHKELHLDYLSSQFILDLRDANSGLFDVVSDIAFASMAAEAIACFREPVKEVDSLEGLVIYLDSPLLLDMLNVNSDYVDYGKELLEIIKSSGAKAAILSHCVEEAEVAVHAQLNYLRSGVNQNSYRFGVSVKPDLLCALSGAVGKRAHERLGVEVEADPELNQMKRAPTVFGDIESDMEKRMQSWRNDEAKAHDRKSVWSMISFRDIVNYCPKICDSKNLFVTRNTALVEISNSAWRKWLKGVSRHSSMNVENWAPISLSDKQFAGYVWMRGGNKSTDLPIARLLAHCSSAIRPRADVKAAAINLVLELNGKEEADDITVLLEDREGGRALMRATKGDPEDITPERLPFILDEVRKAAGEFAAQEVREEAERTLAETILRHQEEIDAIKDVKREEDRSRAVIDSERAAREAKMERRMTEVSSQLDTLAKALVAKNNEEQLRHQRICIDGFNAGVRAYKFLRWIMALLVFLAVLVISYYPFSSKITYSLLAATISVCVFWFIPDFLNKPFSHVANRVMRRYIVSKEGVFDYIPSVLDFSSYLSHQNKIESEPFLEDLSS
jgi:hypothetical protein